MAVRADNKRLRRILLGVIGLVVGIGAFVLLFVLAPGSNDPGEVGRILGSIGAVAGGLGLLLVIWGLFTRPVKR